MLTQPTTQSAPAPAAQATRRRWRGWVEAAVIFAAYEAFESVRARVQGKAGPSFHHARQVIHWEQLVGIFRESQIQSWFLPHHLIIEFWDIWYGTVHFVIPPLALVLLYHRCPARYRHHRDALVALTLVSLVCFWAWPLAPPRLLPASYHFVDTAKRIGGMGVADKGSMADDNAYAAMPSLHIAWSSWCAFTMVPILRHWWTRALVILYPFVTLTAVVVTANHFLLDGIGGLIVLGLGWLIASAVDGLRSVDPGAEKVPDGKRHARGRDRHQQLAERRMDP